MHGSVSSEAYSFIQIRSCCTLKLLGNNNKISHNLLCNLLSQYHCLTASIGFTCRLELNDYISVSNNTENAENQEDNSASTVDDNEMPLPLKRAYVFFQQAVERVNDIKFIIELLKITEKYDNTEKLQKKIIR